MGVLKAGSSLSATCVALVLYTYSNVQCYIIVYTIKKLTNIYLYMYVRTYLVFSQPIQAQQSSKESDVKLKHGHI